MQSERAKRSFRNSLVMSRQDIALLNSYLDAKAKESGDADAFNIRRRDAEERCTAITSKPTVGKRGGVVATWLNDWQTYAWLVILLNDLDLSTKDFLEFASREGADGAPGQIVPCKWPTEQDQSMNQLLEQMDAYNISTFGRLVSRLTPWKKAECFRLAEEGYSPTPSVFLFIDDPFTTLSDLVTKYGVRCSRPSDGKALSQSKDGMQLRALTTLLRDFSISPHYILGSAIPHTVLCVSHEIECIMDRFITLSETEKDIVLRLASDAVDAVKETGV